MYRTRKSAAPKWVILALIFAVAALSVAAKHSQFLPGSDPGRIVSKITKMNLGHAPDLFLPLLACAIPEVLPAPPEFRGLVGIHAESFDLPQLHLTLSLQHRSPPLSA